MQGRIRSTRGLQLRLDTEQSPIIPKDGQI